MIDISISIKNPFWKSSMDRLFRNYMCVTLPVTKNKTFEFEVIRHFWNILSVRIDLNYSGSDHAGPSIELNLLGYEAKMSLRDNRHWDDDENTWETNE